MLWVPLGPMVPFRVGGASFRRRAGGVAALWCVLGLLLLGGGAVSSTPLDGGDDTMQPVDGLEMGHARFTSPRFSRAAAEEAGRDDVGGKVLEAGIARVSSSLHRFSDKMRSLTNALAGQGKDNVTKARVGASADANVTTNASNASKVTWMVDGVSRPDGTRWFPRTGEVCPNASTETMRLVSCTERGCRLETKFEEEWGTVCSAGWRNRNAPGLCRAFGFADGGVTVRDIGGGKGQVWLEDVSCLGSEGDVGDCAHPTWGETSDCGHGEDVGMCCFGGPEPTMAPKARVGPSKFARCPGVTGDDMRLVDCNREVCRLEVKHKDEWGTVCDNGFTFTSANTVCNILGFQDGGKFKQMCATEGARGACKPNKEGSGTIWLDHVVCYGYERDLEGCRRLPWGKHQTCTHEEDVGVCCKGRQGPPQMPSECKGGELDWDFKGKGFASTTGGPALTPLFGGKIDGMSGFKFEPGQGLGVDPSGCVGSEVYSIYIRAKFKEVTGWKDLFRSNGWKNYGLYINNNLMLSPADSGVECAEKIKPNVFYQYVMTRASDGTVSLYINGAMCASGKPAEEGGFDFRLNPHSMLFLTDNGQRDGAGVATHVRAFNRVLPDEEVAKICDCKLPVFGKACDRTLVINSYPQGTLFSSVRSGGEPGPGKGHSAARLNSPQAWSAASKTAGEWMQFDTGSVQTIVGVVMQGRADAKEWVTQFRAEVSPDGIQWVKVGCGRVFDANYDRHSKVKVKFQEPVFARFVKIMPVEWHVWPSMRAGALVCERMCEGGELDYDFQLTLTSRTRGPALDPFWGEGQYRVTPSAGGGIPKYMYEFMPGEGLLLNQRRCMKASSAWTLLMDVRLDDTVGYRRLLSSHGWGDYGLYVNKYLQLTPRNARMKCPELIRPKSFYKIVMSRSATGIVKLFINGDRCAMGSPPYLMHYDLHPNSTVLFRDDSGEDTGGAIKNLHMWNRDLDDKEVAQVCDCKLTSDGKPCDLTVVYNLPISKMKFTSTRNGDASGTGYGSGRLNSQKAWVPKTEAQGKEYLEMDLGTAQSVAGVVVQGRRDQPEWVTSFQVTASVDGVDWREVGCGMRFEGNGEQNARKKVRFTRPVHAQYLRIYPMSWHGAPAMRAGALLCEKPCIRGELDYRFKGGFASLSGGPSLDPAWGDGTFEDVGEDEHYEFGAGQGVVIDPSRCWTSGEKAYTVVMRIKLKTVAGYRALMTSNGWGKAGLYVKDGLLQLSPDGANSICTLDPVNANVWTYVAMVREDSGKTILYVNGYPCAQGDVPFLDHYALSPMYVELLRDEYGRNSAGSISRLTMYDKGLDAQAVANECGCALPAIGEKCDTNVILNVVYASMSSSSIFQGNKIGEEYGRGRLNSRGSWRAATAKAGAEYLQLDTGASQSLAGVATQGRRDDSEWVTAFRVKVSSDGSTWTDVECGRTFKGNVDRHTKHRALFRDPVQARYVRIYPMDWQSWPSMRAGALICERACSGGKLKYDLTTGSLLSSTDGPALVVPWGEGFFAGSKGYRFEAGGGFTLDQDEDGCMNGHVAKPLHPNTEYTIIMTVSLDVTNRWVRLIGSNGWGDDGLYVNSKLRFQPSGMSMSCPHLVQPGRYYKFGITRGGHGELALYINGAQCFKGHTMKHMSFELDQHNVVFFHDDGGENSAGYVKDIRVYSRALSESLMAQDAGCVLPPEGKVCKRTISLRPQDSQMRYSSTFADDHVGIGYARGRLNSPQAWVAKEQKKGQWMQIDTGEEQSISGVVTQGRRDFDWWVTALSVEISNDGFNYTAVECGVPYTANFDRNSKARIFFRKPVRARYVRIVPDTWNGGIGMRASVIVCERKCEGGKLDYEFADSLLSSTKGPILEDRWGEGSFVKDEGYRFKAGEGLTLDQSPCIKSPKEWTLMMQVRLDNTEVPTALMRSDGWGAYGIYISGSQLLLRPSGAQESCREKIMPGVYYKVVVTREANGEVAIYLNGLRCADGVPPYLHAFLPSETGLTFLRGVDGAGSSGYIKRLTIYDKALTKETVADRSGCRLAAVAPKKCEELVVMNAPYSSFGFSSTLHGHRSGHGYAQPRLASPRAWCPSSPSVGQYLEIDTGSVQSLAGVVTQGRRDANQWVYSFKVMVSSDGRVWDDVQCGEMFTTSPTGNQQRVKTQFDAPAVARYVRIYPQGWVGYPCMRAGVLLCETTCKHHELDYRFRTDLNSSTMGPALVATWGEGQFHADGYHFGTGQGLTLSQGHCVGREDWTVLMQVSLNHVSGYRRLFNTPGWGDYGFYIRSGRFMLYPTNTHITCTEAIHSHKIYKFGITRSKQGVVSLYLNGYMCSQGTPIDYADGFTLSRDEVSFMRDNGSGEMTGGDLRRIRMWGRALSEDEMSLQMGCTPYTKTGAACSRSVTYNAPYAKIQYSSVWNREPVGQHHGRGRLNSHQAWSAGRNVVGEWMQIDAGSVTSIEGVVTQGRYHYGQWVSAYRISVSDDGSEWSEIECGRVFNGNKDNVQDKINLFDKPVKARYVRIIVRQWHSHISMRAGLILCEEKCKNGELDYTFAANFDSDTKGPALVPQWGEGRFYSSRGYVFGAGKGLALDESACISNPKIWSILMRVSLHKVHGWNKILGSAAWYDYGLYVYDGVFMLFPRAAGMVCKRIPILPGVTYQFGITHGETGELALFVNGYKCAEGHPALARRFEMDHEEVTFMHDDGSQNTGADLKRIRVWSETKSDGEMMEMSGCTAPKYEKPCDTTIILNQPYSKISYSSTWGNQAPGTGHGTGRLNSRQAWTASTHDVSQWMEIDTGAEQTIAGIVTQGRRRRNYRGTDAGNYGVHNQWVTRYRVEVTDGNRSAWTPIQCGLEFVGNNDNDKRVRRLFAKPVLARYVRIRPTAWVGAISMRAAVLVCAKECEGGRLDYKLGEAFTSSTMGPSLVPMSSSGDFEPIGSPISDDNGGLGKYCSRQGWHTYCRNCIGTVNYCAHGRCYSRVSTGVIACHDGVFGDPYRGYGKTCYCKGDLGRHCSGQGGQCRCAGTVSYCSGGQCNTKESRDVIACTDQEFGDPKPGHSKKCYCKTTGYKYPRGSGFGLEEAKCIGKGEKYTILIDAVLDDAQRYNALVECDKWNGGGIFVHKGKFQLLPDEADMMCDAAIRSGQLNRYAITRDGAGDVRLYVNGHMCAKDRVKDKNGFSLEGCPKLRLLADSGKQRRDSSGRVERVAIWDKALNDDEIAAESKCVRPATEPNGCDKEMLRTLTYSEFKASSILSNYPMGGRWGQARLDSRNAWIAARNSVGEWLQIDVGVSQTILGVVTQGRGDAGWWTTSFTVSVSVDGETWAEVECGRRFEGSRNTYTKINTRFNPPVVARYVRIYPQTWRGYPSMRAGVTTCQTECTNRHLSYEFKGALSSGTGGNSLTTPWGTNSFSSRGMQFNAGKGLTLEKASSCLGTGKAWSILLEAKLDDVQQETGLMTSKGWANDGLVVRDGLAMLTPTTLICNEHIKSQYYYKYGLTRSAGGQVTIFLNGFPCGSVQTSRHDAFALDASYVTFLREKAETGNAKGYIKSLQVWGSALTNEEMAKECDCSIPESAGKCSKQTTRNVRYTDMRVSSSYGNQAVGTGWGRAQLNSPMCWVPQHWYWNSNSISQWLQLDVGKVDTIAGIVTQGCGHPSYRGWFTTSYTVKVSDDGQEWKDVECGRIFEAGQNAVDKHTSLFTSPVKTRFVRIYPRTFKGTPALRAGLVTCEHSCEGKELDYTMKSGFSSKTMGPALTAPWGEGTFDSGRYRFGTNQGLVVPEMTCIKEGKEWSVLVKVQLDRVDNYKAILTTSGWGEFGVYLDKGKLTVRPSPKLVCNGEPIRPGHVYYIGVSRASSGEMALYINGFMCASATPKLADGFMLPKGKDGNMELFHASSVQEASAGYVYAIKVWGKGLSESDMVLESGCDGTSSTLPPCTGEITVNVPNRQISSSSTSGNRHFTDHHYDCGNPRLNSPTSWCSRYNSVGQYLQLDMSKVVKVGGVVTQGRRNHWQYVSTYKVKYSEDGKNWRDVECGRIFDGNRDLNTKVKNVFEKPVKARYIRIYPRTWYRHMSMRAGVLACENKCEGKHLDYKFDQSLNSDSDGPALSAPWGRGRMGSDKIYRFSAGQGLEVSPQACFTSLFTYSVLLDVRLYSLNDYRAVFTSSNWFANGLYIKDRLLMLRSTSIRCPEPLHTSYYYKIGMTRDKDGTLSLFLNGYKCASGKDANSDDWALAKEGKLDFLRDFKGKKQSSGEMKRLQVWGDKLSADQMAEKSGCHLTTPADQCKTEGYVVTKIPYSKMSASSIWYYWYGYRIGSGWGEGELDSRAGWVSNSWGKTSWLQMDTGSVQTIVGVVTQGVGSGWWGGHYRSYRVSEFRVQVSDDKKQWMWAECGRIYPGNTNTHSKVYTKFSSPVKARYVRILPHAWYGGPALRAGVLLCEEECKNKELDYKPSSGLESRTGGSSLVRIGGGYINGNGFNFGDNQGLSLKKPGTCIGKGARAFSVFTRVYLRDVGGTKGIISMPGAGSSWGDGGVFIQDSYLRMRPSNIVCETEKIKANKWYWVGFTRDKDGNVKLYLNGFKCAEGKPHTANGFLLDGGPLAFGKGPNAESSSPGIIGRVLVWGRELRQSEVESVADCSPAATTVTSCNRYTVTGIPYSKFKASSTYSNDKMGSGQHGRARLNSHSAWVARYNSRGQWLQMDLGEVKKVNGVVTQGRANSNQYVKGFSVEVSEDGKGWGKVECGRVFDANKDQQTAVKNLFAKPVTGRYVRLVVDSWYSHISMRAAVILCETSCSEGHLDYQMEGLRSSTGGPSLGTPWGEGNFIGKERANGFDAPGNDIRYINTDFATCRRECKRNPECVAFNENPSGRGCHLKRKLGDMRLSSWNIVFMTDKPYYKHYAKVGYYVESGKGLVMRAAKCLGKKGKAWSIVIDALVYSTSGMRRIFSSTEWGDDGAYIKNGKFIMYPTAGLVCNEEIEQQRAYRFGVTRDETGKVRLYLNGNLCSSANPLAKVGYTLDTDDVSFFHDRDSRYRTNAYVRRIQAWDRSLTVDEMGDASDCKKPRTAKSCPAKNHMFEPSSRQVKYSSMIWGNYRRRDGRKLTSSRAWVANHRDSRVQKGLEYMQIDLGKTDKVMGFKLRRHYRHGWQVTKMRVLVSEDGEKWTPVECARNFKTKYQHSRGTSVTVSFKRAVYARYVRLTPMSYHGLPAMRAQLIVCDPPPVPPPPPGRMPSGSPPQGTKTSPSRTGGSSSSSPSSPSSTTSSRSGGSSGSRPSSSSSSRRSGGRSSGGGGFRMPSFGRGGGGRRRGGGRGRGRRMEETVPSLASKWSKMRLERATLPAKEQPPAEKEHQTLEDMFKNLF